MKYNEFIQNIIDTRGQWSEDVKNSERGCEIHHIVPKSKGGMPKRCNWSHHSNLIWLYPQEHYEAHRLLAEENKDDYSLVCAYWYMSNNGNYTSVDYENSRKLFIACIKNRPQPEEINKERSKTMLSYHLLWYTNGIDEIRSVECPEGWHKGRKPISEETREKYRQRPKPIGEKNGMYGKHNSPESNKIRSEWSSKRRWFNNGDSEMFILPSECPLGWKPGRLPRSRWGKNK